MATKVKLSRWVEHLAQAQADGVTLAQYARQHGLSKATLYAARQQQRALQTQADTAHAQLPRQGKSARSPFVTVQLPEATRATQQAATLCSASSPTGTTLQARLPNGVHVSIEINPPPVSSGQSFQPPLEPWAQVLQVLAGMPCSR